MKLFPAFPEASQLSLSEIFKHKSFIGAGENNKRKIMLNSAQWRFDYEREHPFEEAYFKKLDLKDLLQDKIVLDLGCFTGGRSVAWTKRYNVKAMYGVDTDILFVESARLFSQKMGVDAHFVVAYGEKMPFKGNFFDAIISFDTFEHVRNLRTVLDECWRVLEWDGILVCVFPQYLSPFEHHLSRVTKTPCLHWFFSGEDLIEIYNEIIEERPDAYWYRRPAPRLEEWEKLNTINGTFIASFRKMVDEFGWHIEYHNLVAILRTGRFFNRYSIFKLLSKFFCILVRIPGLNEFFVDRIVYILKKTNENEKN